MISIFALGSDLPEIEVIRSALSEERTLYLTPTRSVPQVFPDGIPISIARS